jgi:hypothetical protein
MCVSDTCLANNCKGGWLVHMSALLVLTLLAVEVAAVGEVLVVPVS